MIFPNLIHEKTLQVNDRTRLDVSKTYFSGDETSIQSIEISPDNGVTYYNAGSKEYIDYEWSTDGVKTIKVRATGEVNVTPVESEYSINVLSAADDCLFSCDAELVEQEGEIMMFLKKGRNSWLDKHRAAQGRIIEYLDEKGIWNCEGARLTKAAVVDKEEVRAWSKYMVLKMIFEDLRKQPDDFYQEKMNTYNAMMIQARDRTRLRLDKNGDGVIDKNEHYNMTSLTLTRRDDSGDCDCDTKLY